MVQDFVHPQYVVSWEVVPFNIMCQSAAGKKRKQWVAAVPDGFFLPLFFLFPWVGERHEYDIQHQCEGSQRSGDDFL